MVTEGEATASQPQQIKWKKEHVPKDREIRHIELEKREFQGYEILLPVNSGRVMVRVGWWTKGFHSTAAPDPPTFRNWTIPPLDGVVAVSETLAREEIRIGDPLMGAKGPAGATTPALPAVRRSGEVINCGQGAANAGGEVPQLLPDVDRRRPGIPGGVPTQNWTFSIENKN